MLVHMFAKSGSVFAVVAMFLIRMPLILSPKHRSERGHTMIRISLHYGRPEIHCRHRRDLQPIGKLTGITPNSALSR